MREAAEAPHDVAMMFGVLEILGTDAPRQRHGALLVGEIFLMPEGQQKEGLHGR